MGARKVHIDAQEIGMKIFIEIQLVRLLLALFQL